MASDELIMWAGAVFLEYFFLCRSKREGQRILGWFAMFITSLLGVWFNAGGGNPFPLIVGGVLLIISGINLVDNISNSEEYYGGGRA